MSIGYLSIAAVKMFVPSGEVAMKMCILPKRPIVVGQTWNGSCTSLTTRLAFLASEYILPDLAVV